MMPKILNCFRNLRWRQKGTRLCRYLTASTSSGVVDLAYTVYDGATFSQKPPVIIAHGLLGSKGNWHTVGKILNETTGRKIFTVDLRGHGSSAHNPRLDVNAFAEDLIHFLESRQLSKATFVGHSMGARAVMSAAFQQPAKVDRLIVVDMTPFTLPDSIRNHNHGILKAMVDSRWPSDKSLSECRKLVDSQLSSVVEDISLRQFLLTNLVKDAASGQVKWRCDVVNLYKQFWNAIQGWRPPPELYEAPCLFLGGELSPFMPKEHNDMIRSKFIKAEFHYIPDAHHFVHSEKPNEFVQIVTRYLES